MQILSKMLAGNSYRTALRGLFGSPCQFFKRFINGSTTRDTLVDAVDQGGLYNLYFTLNLFTINAYDLICKPFNCLYEKKCLPSRSMVSWQD